MSGNYQLTGTVKFGTSSANVDVSTDVLTCTFRRSFDSVEKPATFGSLRKTMVAGAYADVLEVEYVSEGFSASASNLDGLVANAVFNGTNTLFFDFVADTGAVAAGSNMRYTGTCTVLDFEHGGTVGALRKITQKFPVLTSALAST